MRSKPIDSSLAETKVVSERLERHQENTADIVDDDEAAAIDWFTHGIAATELKDEALAPVIGMNFQRISDYRTGKRPLTTHKLMRLARVNRKAGVALVRYLAKVVGGLRVEDRGRVEKPELRRQLEMSLQRNPAVLRAVLADAADALGIDEEEAASVWDGPTDVDAVTARFAK